ncbi:MAG: hypothetical protein WDW38_003415 [Sanguina aurantia]
MGTPHLSHTPVVPSTGREAMFECARCFFGWVLIANRRCTRARYASQRLSSPRHVRSCSDRHLPCSRSIGPCCVCLCHQVCDVSSLKSVMALAADFQASSEPLHLLVNNAGVMVHQRSESADGYDMNFATNTLGGWALTKLLAPVLEKSSPSKVVFISSDQQHLCIGMGLHHMRHQRSAVQQRADVDVGRGGCIVQGNGPVGGRIHQGGAGATHTRQGQWHGRPEPGCGLAEVLAGQHGGFHRRGDAPGVAGVTGRPDAGDAAAKGVHDRRGREENVEDDHHLARQPGVGAYTMHPGWTTTEGVKDSIPGFYNFFKNKFRDLQQGADTIVWLALQSPDKLEPGAFYLDRAPQTKHLPLGGTQYSKEEVDTLVKTLEGMLHKAQQC